MSDEKPAAIWLHHPASGQNQQVSALAWDQEAARRQADPNIEGGLTGWYPATPDQAAMGESVKAERLAASAPAAPVVELDPPTRRRG